VLDKANEYIVQQEHAAAVASDNVQRQNESYISVNIDKGIASIESRDSQKIAAGFALLIGTLKDDPQDKLAYYDLAIYHVKICKTTEGFIVFRTSKNIERVFNQ
jgi:hypothetical protein